MPITKDHVLVIIDPTTMARLVDALHANPIDGFVEMWRVLEPSWDDLETVTPGDYALLPEQSAQLLEAGKEGCFRAGIDTWVIMGLWLNKGPATEQIDT